MSSTAGPTEERRPGRNGSRKQDIWASRLRYEVRGAFAPGFSLPPPRGPLLCVSGSDAVSLESAPSCPGSLPYCRIHGLDRLHGRPVLSPSVELWNSTVGGQDMRRKDLCAARDAAAAEALERIRRDAEGRRWQTRAFLRYLEDHLFDEKLGVRRIMELCRIGDSAFSLYFHSDIGCSPSEYIRRGKLLTAARLLRDTNFESRLVGEAVGIIGPSRFSALFRQWFGETPTAYRDRCQAGEGPGLPVQDPLFVVDALACKLERRQAELYVAYLRDLYGLPATAPAAFEVPNPQFYDQARSAVVWRRLRGKPFAEQKKLVIRQCGFRTPALFELLLVKSREEGRRSPQRAVQVAELALISLDAAAGALRRDLPDLRARGCAWLANARRRNLDLAGAEEAFERTDTAWAIPRPRKDERVLADILYFKALLNGDQRRFAEALAFADKAIELYREKGPLKRLAEALIARATILGYSGDPEDAIGDLEEALETLVNEADDCPFLRLNAVGNLATIYALGQRFDDAERLLPEALALAAEIPHRTAAYHLRWTEGLVAQGRDDNRSAELCFLDALRGFTTLDDPDHGAVAALDLALLYSEEGRMTEALELAARTVPVFDALKIRREAAAALDLIRESLARSSFPVGVARRLRGHIGELRKDPLFGRPNSEPRSEGLGNDRSPAHAILTDRWPFFG